MIREALSVKHDAPHCSICGVFVHECRAGAVAVVCSKCTHAAATTPQATRAAEAECERVKEEAQQARLRGRRRASKRPVRTPGCPRIANARTGRVPVEFAPTEGGKA